MNYNKVLDYFYLLKKKDLIGTSYLFIGDNFSLLMDIVKVAACRNDEYFCNCCWDCKRIDGRNHPDVFYIEPAPAIIKIEQIREGQRFLYLKSFCLKKKIMIVDGGENLGLEAANAFLKTLEEPPNNSFIAICASKIEGLLPTIISRCRKILLPFKEKETDEAFISHVVDFLQGERTVFRNRSDFSSFLWTLTLLFRDYLVSKTGSQDNRLIKSRNCEIISKTYSLEDAENILKEILKIYRVYNTINQNLALNLIRMKL